MLNERACQDSTSAWKINDGENDGYPFLLDGEDYTYGVFIVTPENGSISCDTVTAESGTNISGKAEPSSKYSLTKLAINDTGLTADENNSFTFEMPAKNAVISAEFENTVYNITIGETTNGAVRASKQQAYMGDTVVIIIAPHEGYELEELIIGNQDLTNKVENNRYLLKVSSDVNISCTFRLKSYKINCVNDAISCEVSSATAGSEVTVRVSGSTTIQSITMSGNGESTYLTKNSDGSYTFIMPEYNVTIEAAIIPPECEWFVTNATSNSLDISEGSQIESIISMYKSGIITDGFKDYTFNLVNDIEYSGESIEFFNGVFDGGKHKVTLDGEPLFAEIGAGGVIKNTVFDGKVYGDGKYLGAVCRINRGKILNCEVNFCEVSGAENIGGIAGLNEGSAVNCLSNCKLYNSGMTASAGGICANNVGTIKICTFSGSFEDTSLYNWGSVCGYSNEAIEAVYYIIAPNETLISPTALISKDKISGAKYYTVSDGIKSRGGLSSRSTVADLLNAAVAGMNSEPYGIQLSLWTENRDKDSNVPAQLLTPYTVLPDTSKPSDENKESSGGIEEIMDENTDENAGENIADTGENTSDSEKNTWESKDTSAEIRYSAHIEDYGWLAEVGNGELAGTAGEALRMEALTINISSELEGSVVYRAHIKDDGWLDWVKDGEVAGTTNRSLRAEAFEIYLTGELAEVYSVKYRAHIEDAGWLDWVSDGQTAGTTGQSLRLEGIQIVLVRKDMPEASVSYCMHIKDEGWLETVSDGISSGTVGEEIRAEAIQIYVNSAVSGGIEYRAHVQDYGWLDWARDGETAGTTGEGIRAEALEIRLTGELAEKFSVKYRVHIQNQGWLDWARDGETAGTTGQSLQIEAVQIIIEQRY